MKFLLQNNSSFSPQFFQKSILFIVDTSRPMSHLSNDSRPLAILVCRFRHMSLVWISTLAIELQDIPTDYKHHDICKSLSAPANTSHLEIPVTRIFAGLKSQNIANILSIISSFILISVKIYFHIVQQIDELWSVGFAYKKCTHFRLFLYVSVYVCVNVQVC